MVGHHQKGLGAFGVEDKKNMNKSVPDREEKPIIALMSNHDDDIFCFRLEIVKVLLDNGFRVLISCPDGPKFKVMEEMGIRKGHEYIYDDAPIDRRGMSVITDSKLVLHYYRLVKKYRPAVCLAFTAKPNVYMSFVGRVMKTPVICNVTGLGSVVNTGQLKKWFILKLYGFAYRRSSCVMIQNDSIMKYAKKNRWIRGEAVLIPGSGVDLNRYPYQEYPKGGNGRDGECVIFNYMGRIMREKGVDDYIEVAKIIKKKYPNCEFNLIGFIEPTESHYKEVLSKLEQQGIVKYRGQQTDVRPWIAKAHVLIHPSAYGEGMSNVILENASSGRPVITTDIPGCKEAVDDGKTGFIYHVRNVASLTNVITKFLEMKNDEREKMGIEGRKKVGAEFSRDTVCKLYLERVVRFLK